MRLTFADADGPRTIRADRDGGITLLVRSGGLQVGDGPEAFTIYEEGELVCEGTPEVRVASPGCTTVFDVLRGSVA